MINRRELDSSSADLLSFMMFFGGGFVLTMVVVVTAGTRSGSLGQLTSRRLINAWHRASISYDTFPGV